MIYRRLPPRSAKRYLTSTFATLISAALLIAGCSAGTPPMHNAAAQRVITASFDLGDTKVTFPDHTTAVLRRRGVVSTPKVAPHTAPVVLLLGMRTAAECADAHAYPCPAGTTENRYERAYPELVNALTRAGNVVVSIEMNSIHFVHDRGEPGTTSDPTDGLTRINRVALDILKAFRTASAKLPASAVTAARPSQVMVIGHSHGGELALQLPRALTSAKYHVLGVLALAPSVQNLWGENLDPNANLTLPDVPIAITTGTCDGDTGQDALTLIHRLRATPRTAPVTWLIIRGANHTGFTNHRLLQAEGDLCKPVPAPRQRTWVSASATSIVTALRAGRTAMPLSSSLTVSRLTQGPGSVLTPVAAGADGQKAAVGAVTDGSKPALLCLSTMDCIGKGFTTDKRQLMPPVPFTNYYMIGSLAPQATITFPRPTMTSTDAVRAVRLRLAAPVNGVSSAKVALIAKGKVVATAAVPSSSFIPRPTPEMGAPAIQINLTPQGLKVRDLTSLTVTVSGRPIALIDAVIEH